MRLAFLSALAVCLACGACTPAAQPQPPPSPTADQKTAPVPGDGDAWTITGTLEREKLPAAMPELPLVAQTFPAPPKGLLAPPAGCAAYMNRAPVAAPCAGPIPGEVGTGVLALSEALALTDPHKRDAELAGLEECNDIAAGLVRALRAELAPAECGDAIVAAALQSPGAMSGAVYDALFGLGLAGMLNRAASQPPKMTKPPTKANVEAFIASEMKSWVDEQATAIQDLSKIGSKLRYYGKAIVAVEAGMADMRFIDAVRSVPVPDEFNKDDEVRETYLTRLEMALDARKKRGRDAALVGLGNLATVGVLRDPRVDRARALLSRMFGGRPINALDALLLPPLTPRGSDDPIDALFARLQTFYVGLNLPPDATIDAKMLRALIEKGLSLPHRIALAKAEPAAGEARLLLARARLELGQIYWRRVDFDEAARLLSDWPASKKLPPEGRLLLAVAIALRGGHENAADMMVKAPIADLGIGRIAALDALVAEGSPFAGEAAFDAALIKQLAAPADAPADYWTDLAARYRKAKGLLQDIRHQQAADERAREAEETAAAIGSPE